MSATNLNDAKKECDGEKRNICDMFYQSSDTATHQFFYACENSATIARSDAAPILYELLSGNKIFMQYEYFKDRDNLRFYVIATIITLHSYFISCILE